MISKTQCLLRCLSASSAVALAALLAAPATAQQGGASSDNINDVVLSGSEVLGKGIMPILLEGYAGSRGAVGSMAPSTSPDEFKGTFVADQGFGDDLASYTVQIVPSSAAFRALTDGSADVAMTTRRISANEAAILGQAGAGDMFDPDQERVIAVDSMVVILHPNNPVTSLTVGQVADIYAGQITNWSQVGGENQPITAFAPTDGTSARGVFQRGVLDVSGDRFSTGVISQDTNNEIAASVNADEGAIGFVSFAFQRGAKPIDLVNECGIHITPDSFSARTEEYPLQQRMFLYVRGDNDNPVAGEMLDFAVSEVADPLITKAGFIDFSVARRAQPADGFRAESLRDADIGGPLERELTNGILALLPEYDRLSTTFRFQTASAELNERGLLDMQRLARYLQGQPDGTKVRFVGFTDSVGDFTYNRNLSLDRARSAKEQFEAFAGDQLSNIDIDFTGFGEVAPSGCNISDVGRGINRRVEVWISNAG